MSIHKAPNRVPEGASPHKGSWHHGHDGHAVAHPPNESGGVEHPVDVPAGGTPKQPNSYHVPSERPASADHHSMHSQYATAEEFNTGHRSMATPDRSGVLNADAQASDYGSHNPRLTDSGGLRERLRSPDRGRVSEGAERTHVPGYPTDGVAQPRSTATSGGGTHSEASNHQPGRARVKGR